MPCAVCTFHPCDLFYNWQCALLSPVRLFHPFPQPPGMPALILYLLPPEMCWLSIQRSGESPWEWPTGVIGVTLVLNTWTCNADVCSWLLKNQMREGKKKWGGDWISCKVYQKSNLCIQSQILDLGQSVCWLEAQDQDSCSWGGTTLSTDARPGFLPSESPHSTWKCQNVHTRYFQQLKLLLHLRSHCCFLCLLWPRLSWLFHFPYWQHHMGQLQCWATHGKRGHGDFWWFVPTGLFALLPVSVMSLKYIFLEVNSLWATTSHPWTKVKNKSNIRSGPDAGAELSRRLSSKEEPPLIRTSMISW